MPHCFVEAILKITFKKIFIDPREGGDEIPEQSISPPILIFAPDESFAVTVIVTWVLISNVVVPKLVKIFVIPFPLITLWFALKALVRCLFPWDSILWIDLIYFPV